MSQSVHIKPPSGSKSIWLAAAVVFIIFLIYYFLVFYIDIKTDIQLHAVMAEDFVVEHRHLTPNFLYYFLVALVSGFSNDYQMYCIASIILMSGAITAKFTLNHICIKKLSTISNDSSLTWAIAFAMLFVFPLPGWDFYHSMNFYKGQLPANIWHNSTTIFVMPFAMLLFFKSYELLFSSDAYHNKKLLTYITFLIVINALIKPSFLFTLLPSFFILFYFNQFSNSANSKAAQLLPYILGIIFIAAEYYAIYKLNYLSIAGDEEKASVVLAPFQVWRYFSGNILIATITSLFFPLVYLCLTKGNPLRNKLTQFALTNFIIGLCIWILFAEDGARKLHGNFFWQVVITTYLLFFSLLLNFINDVDSNKLTRNKQLIIGGAFMLHFIWGIVYWIRIIALKNIY